MPVKADGIWVDGTFQNRLFGQNGIIKIYRYYISRHYLVTNFVCICISWRTSFYFFLFSQKLSVSVSATIKLVILGMCDCQNTRINNYFSTMDSPKSALINRKLSVSVSAAIELGILGIRWPKYPQQLFFQYHR
jgi:hypothetical protein